MKMKPFLSLLLLFCIHARLQAQAGTATAADTAQIKATLLNYVQGFYEGDAKRVEKAVHPELAKRIVVKDTTGMVMISNMGASGLIYAAAHSKKKKEENGPAFAATISIYDIFNDVATVKVVTNKFKFIDYVQLAKVNGDWKIINVLWAMTN